MGANRRPNYRSQRRRTIALGVCLDATSEKPAPQSVTIANTNPPPLMTKSIKQPVLLLFALALLTLVSTGCNTAHGFGKDVEKAGDKIQEGTD